MEPYKNAHKPWEPNSWEMVVDYINLEAVKRDELLYASILNMTSRGFYGRDLLESILAICQSADAVLLHIMDEV